jgi:hypothetical protein
MNKLVETAAFVLVFCCSFLLYLPPHSQALNTATDQSEEHASKEWLHIEHDDQCRVIRVYRGDGNAPILVQNAYEDTRPYIYPLVAPDGKGLLTEFRPWHHPHQMGIFWGFKFINGRDYFMKWQGDYYRKVSAAVIQARGQQVKWKTVYSMLDEKGEVILTETQKWSMVSPAGKYVLDLDWEGDAKANLSISQYYVGGLFIRMPWHSGVRAEAINSVGQQNQSTDAQRAKWVDMGIQVDGRNDLAHIVAFDSPTNTGFPVMWRVDSQFGFGPDRSWRAWTLQKGQSEVLRYRLLSYTGDSNPAEVTRTWTDFANGKSS